jgi:quercetin dioxygenase-like cupin family protein
MGNMVKKNFDSADESKQPADKIKIETVQLGGTQVSRVTCQAGWRWSVDLKPVHQTDSCPVDHLLYMISGTMTVRMDDGQELSYSPGDLAHIPPGHDGWSTGDEPNVWIEIPH